ncbi:MAG: hypothetical protein P8I55_15150 [Crocinitomix sp.]|nr:hypothetical protein [Crocinitomix sp.]
MRIIILVAIVLLSNISLGQRKSIELELTRDTLIDVSFRNIAYVFIQIPLSLRLVMLMKET